MLIVPDSSAEGRTYVAAASNRSEPTCIRDRAAAPATPAAPLSAVLREIFCSDIFSVSTAIISLLLHHGGLTGITPDRVQCTAPITQHATSAIRMSGVTPRVLVYA